MGADSTQDQAFEQLVRRYQSALLKICYLYLRDRSLAEDAVQETFIKVYRGMAQFRGDCPEKNWIIRIAIHTCCDMNRSGWLRLMDRRFTPDMLPEAAVPFAPYEEDLVTAILRLPVKLREVVILYYYQGMNTVEIAGLLGLSQSSVSGRLKRARDRLRRAMEGRESRG